MNKVTNLEPVFVSLGYPRAEFIHLVGMVLLFTGIAVAIFIFVTRQTRMGKEVEILFGKRVFSVAKSKAFLVVFALWFFACSWFYNSTLGSKFFELRGTPRGTEVEWELIYKYPERSRFLSGTEITNWTGEIVWSRRRANHSLRLETKSGRALLSVGAHPEQFKKESEKLVPFNITVLPEQKQR